VRALRYYVKSQQVAQNTENSDAAKAVGSPQSKDAQLLHRRPRIWFRSKGTAGWRRIPVGHRHSTITHVVYDIVPASLINIAAVKYVRGDRLVVLILEEEQLAVPNAEHKPLQHEVGVTVVVEVSWHKVEMSYATYMTIGEATRSNSASVRKTSR